MHTQSLGAWKGKTPEQLAKDVVWIRGDEIFDNINEKQNKVFGFWVHV
jgi:hypothetical protein